MRLRTVVSALAAIMSVAAGVIALAPDAAAKPSCAVGPSLVGSRLDFGFGGFIDPNRAFVEFSATNGRGVWAGVAYSGIGEVVILRWAGGHTTVLDHIDFLDSTFQLDDAPASSEQASVEVAGVDASGAVIAAVQVPHTDYEQGRQRGFRYAGGHKYQLATSRTWVTARPTGVAPDGTVVGVVQNNRSQPQVEMWRGSGSGQATHLTGPNGAQYAAITNNHDLAYSTGDARGYVRLAKTGRVITLGGVRGEASTSQHVMGASATSFYGVTYGSAQTRALRWQVSPTSVGPLLGSKVSNLVSVAGVGLNGAVAGTPWISGTSPDETYRNLVANGGVWRLAPQYKMPFGAEPPVAVSPTGVVVYTGTDHLPHTYTCHR